MLRITPLIWALLDLIPVWPHRGHLQPFRQFALMPSTEPCLHVLHEVSVHRVSPPKSSRHEWVSVSIESSLSLTGSSSAAASFVGWKVEVLKLQICVFTGCSFDSNTFFFLCSTFGPAAPRRTSQIKYCSSFKTKTTVRSDPYVFGLHACTEKTELHPKLGVSRSSS